MNSSFCPLPPPTHPRGAARGTHRFPKPQPSLQRTARLRKNQDLLRSLRSQHGARLRLRAERGPSPQELVKQASLAARLQDLDIIRLEAGIERREPAQWDELRVWDPGDG